MSKNSEYETRQKAKGLKKITIWVPEDTEIEFKSMAQFCVENRDHVPLMVRNLTNGQMKKGV